MMKTFVRKAVPEDASFSVQLILEAIGDIAHIDCLERQISRQLRGR